MRATSRNTPGCCWSLHAIPGRTFVGTAGNRNGWRRRQQYSTPLPAGMDAIVADARHAGMGGRIAINSQDYDFN